MASRPGRFGTILTLLVWSRTVLSGRQFASMGVGVGMIGLALGNRSRWRAVVGGLLAVVMLACPMVCRAGACCSNDAVESSSGEVDDAVCQFCDQQRRSPVLPMSPDKPARHGRCLCTGVALAGVATAPGRPDGFSRHSSTFVSPTHQAAVTCLGDAERGRLTRATSGRAVCCANGVLNC